MIEKGLDPPEVFFNQPRIEECNAFYWEAFQDLSTERQIGMGIGPIPRSATMSYASESGLFGDAAEQFASIIRMVDVEYLRMINSVSPSKGGRAGKENKPVEVPINDTAGVKQLLLGLGARAKAKKDRMN